MSFDNRLRRLERIASPGDRLCIRIEGRGSGCDCVPGSCRLDGRPNVRRVVLDGQGGLGKKSALGFPEPAP